MFLFVIPLVFQMPQPYLQEGMRQSEGLEATVLNAVVQQESQSCAAVLLCPLFLWGWSRMMLPAQAGQACCS